MTEVTLHAKPRMSDVVREQVSIVGRAYRREALIAAGLLVIITLLVAIDIVRGRAETWFDSDQWSQIAAVWFLFPFALWWKEKPFGAGFLWTLPVERRRLALARVFAGWVWLTAVLAAIEGWERFFAFVAGVRDPKTIPLVAFVAGTAAYLVGSALALGLRHPIRWVAGTGGVLLLLGILDNALDFTDRLRLSIDPAHAPLFYALSVGAGVVALWAALARHRETR